MNASNSSMRPALPWYPKTDKNITRKENYGPISLMNTSKNILYSFLTDLEYLCKCNSTICKKDTIAWPNGVYASNAGMIYI